LQNTMLTLVGENRRLRSVLLALVTPLILGLAGLGYQLIWQPMAALGSSARTLSLLVDKSGSDFRVRWNRDSVTMAGAEAGVLRIRDGDYQQEFHLDVDELRTGSVLYIPASNHVQFRLEISAAGQRRVSESILPFSAPVPLEPTAAAENIARYPATIQQTLYAVQIGAFQHRANADKLLQDIEARYGNSHLVARRGDPFPWRVLVGRETTADAAGALAKRIRSDLGLAQRQAFVIAERVHTPRL
jgi:hypothetical protein